MATKKEILRPKEALFVREYLKDREYNATRAYTAAGYKAKNANVAAASAAKLLRKPKIAAEIAKVQAEDAKRLDISREKILQELALMGFANMIDYIGISEAGEAFIDFSDLTREQAAAIAEITSETYVDGYEGSGKDKKPIIVKRTKFKLADKRGPLTDLGKHLGIFKEKLGVELTGPDEGPVQVSDARSKLLAKLAR